MRILVNPSSRDRAQKAINEVKARFAGGEAFVVEFSKAKPIHSDDQRGYYRASITAFGEELGYNAKDSHEIIHRECLCRLFGIDQWIERPDGARIPVPAGSSKKLDKATYSRLIEELLMLAGEEGYVIPPPRADG